MCCMCVCTASLSHRCVRVLFVCLFVFSITPCLFTDLRSLLRKRPLLSRRSLQILPWRKRCKIQGSCKPSRRCSVIQRLSSAIRTTRNLDRRCERYSPHCTLWVSLRLCWKMTKNTTTRRRTSIERVHPADLSVLVSTYILFKRAWCSFSLPLLLCVCVCVWFVCFCVKSMQSMQ
jgi:hypothetical protein